ncbi:hypothetical protein, partial [Porphyromonas sp. COT-290 OH860]|uniref:hypothetical protein n=1 Tax=Porphyromonas sp. COT-290 OH860 TaxID=1515615 RepID=UPI001F37BA88
GDSIQGSPSRSNTQKTPRKIQETLSGALRNSLREEMPLSSLSPLALCRIFSISAILFRNQTKNN